MAHPVATTKVRSNTPPYRVIFKHPHPELGPLQVCENADRVLVLGLDFANDFHQLLVETRGKEKENAFITRPKQLGWELELCMSRSQHIKNAVTLQSNERVMVYDAGTNRFTQQTPFWQNNKIVELHVHSSFAGPFTSTHRLFAPHRTFSKTQVTKVWSPYATDSVPLTVLHRTASHLLQCYYTCIYIMLL